MDAKHFSLPQSETLFRLFGQHITSIGLLENSEDYTDIMVGFIGHLCPNVKRMMTRRVAAMAVAFDGNEQSLACQEQRHGTKPVPYGHLEVLELNASGMTAATLPDIKLPSLRRLSVSHAENMDQASVQRFLAINKTIRSLTLNCTTFDGDIDEFFQSIPDLVELEMDAACLRAWSRWPGNYACFGDLQKLTTFKYYGYDEPDACRLMEVMHAANVPLEHVVLTACAMYPKVINSMPTIKRLEIKRHTSHDIVQMVPEFVRRNANVEFIEIEAGDLTLDWIVNVLSGAHGKLKKINIVTYLWYPDDLEWKELEGIQKIVSERTIELNVCVWLGDSEVKKKAMDMVERYKWLKMF